MSKGDLCTAFSPRSSNKELHRRAEEVVTIVEDVSRQHGGLQAYGLLLRGCLTPSLAPSRSRRLLER